MGLRYEERLSDSPFIERIWRTQSAGRFYFTSTAISHWFMALWTQEGQTRIAIHGPKTFSMIAPVPEYADFIGIVLKHGTVMPQLLASQLVNDEIELPAAGTSKSFWLNSRAWQFPTYENADTFIDQLVRYDTLVREPVVDAALHGSLPDLSSRSLQRRVLRATGLSNSAIYQIERARQATLLLQAGMSILDTVFHLGYADQPHLTRALRQLIGLTPAQLTDSRTSEHLSFLFKTSTFQDAILLPTTDNARRSSICVK